MVSDLKEMTLEELTIWELNIFLNKKRNILLEIARAKENNNAQEEYEYIQELKVINEIIETKRKGLVG